jgi:hypothetical protein
MGIQIKNLEYDIMVIDNRINQSIKRRTYEEELIINSIIAFIFLLFIMPFAFILSPFFDFGGLLE